MIYFEKDKMKELLGIPEKEEPVLMITMGKTDKSSTKNKGNIENLLQSM